MDENYYYEPRTKSTFVTVIGVIFIILAALSLFGILAQTVIFNFLPQSSEISQRMQEQMDNGTMPAFQRFLLTYKVPLMIFSLVFAIIQMIAAIGLLMRQNWARIVFIIVMSVLIALRILSIGTMFFAMPQLPNSPQSSATFLTTFMIVIRLTTFLFAIGLSILYAWIISKLLSQKIRMEFLPEMQPKEIYNDEEIHNDSDFQQ